MRRLLAILLLATAMFAAQGAAPKWEEVNTPPVELTADTNADNESSGHTVVKNGYVYIYTSEPVTVKIFTILGQLISTEKVAPGTHRLKINTRGIYILKLGSMTRRITI
ncbi:MAG: T9SS type A sorting domain-containing protein [Barnesiella sp.]|nr:T9SS type A sorting domain-containing protein [Barnesiella sp.]